MSMPCIPAFDPHEDPATVSTRWNKWISRFKNAMTGYGIDSLTRQRCLLLHFGGEALQDIFETLNDTGNTDELDPAVKALTDYFTPKKNVSYETLKFRAIEPQREETVDQFCTRLRKEAGRCDFHDKEREIKTQILDKWKDDTFLRRAMEKERTLDNLLELARTMEISNMRAKDIGSRSGGVNKVEQRSQHTSRARQSARKCFQCGYDWPHDGDCPAKGKECHRCGKINHFSSCCEKTTRRRPETVSSTSRSRDGHDGKDTHTGRKSQSQRTHTARKSHDTSHRSHDSTGTHTARKSHDESNRSHDRHKSKKYRHRKVKSVAQGCSDSSSEYSSSNSLIEREGSFVTLVGYIDQGYSMTFFP